MVHKKKILYVITQGVWGGAQRYVFDLAVNLSNDFEVSLAIGESAGTHDLQNKMAKFPDIKVYQLKNLVRKISLWHDFLAIFELVKLYRHIRPDIVHLNSSKAGVVGALAKTFYALFPSPYSLKVVYTVHGWVFHEPLPKLIQEIYFWAEKISARWKSKIIVLSKEEQETAVTNLGLKEDKISLIPLGIGTINFLDRAAARAFFEKLSGQKFENVTIVGTVANLFRTKGLDVLINAVNIIKERTKHSVKFVIVGDGPERQNLAKLIKKDGLENEVLLCGGVAEADRYLQGFDLFVLPSRKEGFPYTLLEAEQARVPIVATKVGGVASLIKDKVNGLLVSAEDHVALANVLEYALDHMVDMKTMANHSLERHDLSKMLQVTANLYDQLS